MIQGIQNEVQVWRQKFHPVIDVVLFLGERDLAFHGASDRIGGINNGNFFGHFRINESIRSHFGESPPKSEKITNVQISFASALLVASNSK